MAEGSEKQEFPFYPIVHRLARLRPRHGEGHGEPARAQTPHRIVTPARRSLEGQGGGQGPERDRPRPAAAASTAPRKCPSRRPRADRRAIRPRRRGPTLTSSRPGPVAAAMGTCGTVCSVATDGRTRGDGSATADRRHRRRRRVRSAPRDRVDVLRVVRLAAGMECGHVM